MGVYQSAAELAASVELNPLPLAPGAKAPAVRWKTWQERRLPPGLVARWRDDPRHGEANVCTTTGGVVGRIVVDVDSADPADHAEAIARFGDSPAKVVTPSGGLHLWFSSPGGVPNAQRVDGMPVDIRGDGGIAVLPPSVRPEKGEYRFAEGDWTALLRLPLPRPGSLPGPATKAPRKPPGAATRPPETVLDGERNGELFNHMLRFAEHAQSYAEMEAEALRFNSLMPEPMTDKEALGRCVTPWRYRQERTLHPPGKRADRIATPRTAITDLATQHPAALALLMLLQHHHQRRRDVFAISPRAMAPEIGWTEPSLRKARNKLVELGYLVPVNAGGSFHGDAATFRFGF